MTGYRYTQKGRSAYGIAVTAFTGALGVGMLFSRDGLFMGIGAFLLAMMLSGVWAFIRKEEWSIEVSDGVLAWSYARWPRSRGSIGLARVTSMVINDCSHCLSFTFADGSKQEIRLLGSGVRLREYLRSHFPHIAIELVEGT